MKKLVASLSFFLFIFSLIACEEKIDEDELAQIGSNNCRQIAPFVSHTPINPIRAAFSSDAQGIKGIELIQLPLHEHDSIIRYHHPSWVKYGYMGSVVTDDKGNAYTFPIPFVNTLNQTFEEINSIYKIDANTAEMSRYLKLPKQDSTQGIVPYGLLGIYFDCHGKILYAASVSGSTRDKENGTIYAIDYNTKEIVDTYHGIDAFGLCVGGVTGQKRLFFGSGRNASIYSLELSKKGKFKGKHQLELNLDNLGPRGDDKARKIRFDKSNNMIIHGIEFNYSLAAPSIKPETVYKFGYNFEKKQWVLMELH
ncbi:MAG: hypothetical protein R2831_09945 [Chitinophagaceae bacterium]